MFDFIGHCKNRGGRCRSQRFSKALQKLIQGFQAELIPKGFKLHKRHAFKQFNQL
jgi:hypothetical protein